MKTERINALLADTELLLIFSVIICLTFIVAKISKKYFERLLEKKSAKENADLTSFKFIRRAINSIIYLFGFGWALLTLPISATYAHSLFAGAGASTMILGFASQHVLANLMSGLFLVLKKPFKINDIIEVKGNKGKVLELTLHETILQDEENNIIIIPNSLISNNVIKNFKSKNS